jgi:hypothetical protein
MLLGLLLENVGADAAVRLGNPDIWRETLAALTVGSHEAKEEKP